nr:MMPL family transporter [Microbacterium sp. CH12i]
MPDESVSTSRPRVRRHSWLRVLIPVFLILAWVVGAGLGGPLFGKVSEVSSNDQTTYLPESADATQVQKLLGDFKDSDAIPAIAVFVGDGTLSAEQLSTIDEAITAASKIDGIADEVSPGIASKDERAVQAFIPISSDAELGDTVTALGDELRQAAPDGVTVYITGPAGFSADLLAASPESTGSYWESRCSRCSSS